MGTQGMGTQVLLQSPKDRRNSFIYTRQECSRTSVTWTRSSWLREGQAFLVPLWHTEPLAEAEGLETAGYGFRLLREGNGNESLRGFGSREARGSEPTWAMQWWVKPSHPLSTCLRCAKGRRVGQGFFVCLVVFFLTHLQMLVDPALGKPDFLK